MVDDRDNSRSDLAANLRRLRIARALSLSELARETGLSKATLSTLESADANPTLETLGVLARTLRAPLGELLEGPALGEVRVVRAPRGGADREARRATALRALDELAPHHQALEICELWLAPQQRRELRGSASGSRAHVYVLEGPLVAGPAGRPSELAAGDYASFPADVPHSFEAGAAPARLLLLAPASAPA